MCKVSPAASACLVLCLSAVSSAEVVQLSAQQDNTLYEDAAGALSNGAGAQLFAGRNGEGRVRRGLIQFDIASAVPAGATITSAALTMHMTMTSAGPLTVSLHRASAAWGEGTSDAPGGEGGGTAAAPGDATWLHRMFNTTLWTAPGGDYAAVPSAAATVGGNGFYTWSSAGLAADVADMLDQPDANHGWAVIGDESMIQTTKRFDSRTNPNESFRPVLVIEYEPRVPVPATTTTGMVILVMALVAGLVLRSRSTHRGGAGG